MNEAEWATAEHPGTIIEAVNEFEVKLSLRKQRLICILCCRRLLEARPDWPRHELVAHLEDWVEAGASSIYKGDFFSSEECEVLSYDPLDTGCGKIPRWDLEDRVLLGTVSEAPDIVGVALRSLLEGNLGLEEFSIHSNWLRDIFCNPFRPVAFDPSWRTTTAFAIAQTMYDSRDFVAMPILADALEDAGCTQADILDHCRGTGPHVRGCWVVDLVLNKS